MNLVDQKSPGETVSPVQSAQAAAPQLLSKLFPQTAETSPEEGERERQKQEEDNKKEKEKSWKRMKIGFWAFGASAVVFGVWGVYSFGAPELDENGKEIEDEFSKMPAAQQYFKRMWKSMTYYQKMIQEPSREKLLPDTLKYPYVQPPYTLVLEMKDVLVHPDWTYQTGWRFQKRPGVDVFLEQLARHYEIVIFTADQGMTVFPILDALDPKGYIMYRLVRDATHFVDGHHVKNLDNLNRDLTKVIVVDWDANSTKLHPQNTFVIPRWSGNNDDTTLLDLVAFLKSKKSIWSLTVKLVLNLFIFVTAVATSDVQDVREVLEYYRQFDNPLEKFKDNQRKLLEQMAEREREEQSKPKPMVKKWTPSFLGK